MTIEFINRLDRSARKGTGSCPSVLDNNHTYIRDGFMTKFICTIFFLIILAPECARAQDVPAATEGSFNLGVAETGLGFGNSPRHNGIRFNWSDRDIELINGFNFTLWKPKDQFSGTINGIAIGIVSPAAEQINGISLGGLAVIGGDLTGVTLGGLAVVTHGSGKGLNAGGLAVVGDGGLAGLNFGGLAIVGKGGVAGVNVAGLACVTEGNLSGFSFATAALVGKGNLSGINVGGIACVAEGSMSGINLGGVACVSRGSMNGLNFGGLALVAKERLNGINIGGLALVSEGTVSFVNLAGLAVVGMDGIRGLTVGGIGIVSKHDITGLNITLGDLRSDRPEDEISIRGFSFGGYRIRAKEISGINISVAMTQAETAKGLMIGSYNRAYGTQRGTSIGIFNHATELCGIQIGVLNYAENNPKFLRLLPLMNFHF
jgi:hypothetical protein